MLFYIISSIVVAVAVILQTRLRGSLGEAAYYGETNTILRLLMLLTAIAAIRAVNSFIRVYYINRQSANTGFNLRQNFMRHFLRIPFTALEKAGSGESLSIFQTDLVWARQFAGFSIWHFMEDVIFLIAVFGFMFTISPFFTLILIATIPLLAIMQMLASLPIQKCHKVMSEERANFNAVVNDSLQNISTIVSYSLEEVLEERYLTAYDKFYMAYRRLCLTMLPLIAFGFVAACIPLSIINILAALRVINGYMPISDFIAFTVITLLTVEWVATLAERFTGLQTGVANTKRLLKSTSEAEEDISDHSNGAEAPVNIIFSNVSFMYNSDSPPAVNSVDLNIAPGSRVAFVGGSGSGKSTMLKLMLGLYLPTTGEITTPGRDAFAYVPQDSFLFPGSIGSNISLDFSQNWDIPRLEKAAADAGILEFINSLPNKWDDVLQENSENVSGGQRQRIALARAFYRNAPIILFDEATSALDPTTEVAILDSLKNVSKDKTIIMVAHRPSAIAICDQVVVMENGKICEVTQ